jgi:DNA-binding FadR family transcriptional regulator
MVVQPIISETKSSRIATKLEEMILGNQFKAGEFLPSQQTLAKEFGASSRSVREAYKHLEAKGLVHIHQGRRAEIKSNNLDQFMESLSVSILRNQTSNRKLMLDLLQVRISVATSSAREFSRNPDRQEIVVKLRDCCNRMSDLLPLVSKKDMKAINRFHDCDNEFQDILVHSNGNLILNAIYENLSPLLEENVKLIKFSYVEMEKRTRDYSYLCDALQNGQTDLAVALMLVAMTALKAKIIDKFPDEDVASA